MNRRSPDETALEAAPAVEGARAVRFADEAVLSTVYAERREELLGFLVRMVGDPDVAEDLLQETFLKLIREARAGRMPADVRPWLYRVAANAAIDRGRRRSTLIRRLPRLFTSDATPAPDDEVLRAERTTALHSAVARLAPDRRAAVLLSAHGFSGREVAALLGRSELATRTLLCRARLELRDIIEPAEVVR